MAGSITYIIIITTENVREIVISAPTVFELLLLLSDPPVDLLPQLTQLQLSSQHLEER